MTLAEQACRIFDEQGETAMLRFALECGTKTGYNRKGEPDVMSRMLPDWSIIRIRNDGYSFVWNGEIVEARTNFK